MTYKDLLREAWETIKSTTTTPTKQAPLTWQEVFRLFRRSVVLAIWKFFIGFSVFVICLVVLLTAMRVWSEIVQFTK
jgi:hypothetical protein